MHKNTNGDPGTLTKYSDAILDATIAEMGLDEKVLVLGLDVDDHKGIQGTTIGLHKRFGKERCFTTPLSEDAMTGVAIGLAMAGYRPIHVHIRMDFLLLCMNQLVNMAAKAHYTYSGQVKVPLVIRCMIGRSWGQGAQHSQALHALPMHIPGLKVVAPSNAYTAKGILRAAIRDDNPVICVEHRLLYNTKTYIPKHEYQIEIGKAQVMRKGNDITVVAISHMVLETLRAAEALDSLGISVEVIDPISLSPLDIESIAMSVQKTKNLLVVDNAWTTCGAASEIITSIIEKTQTTTKSLAYNYGRIGFADSTCPTTSSLENYFYPNPTSISEKICEMLGTKITKSIRELMSETNDNEINAFKGPF